MRIQFDSVKRIGRKIGLNEDKGFAVAIFLALIIVSATILGYYVLIRPQAEPYNTIFLLDAQKKAFDYPGTLVANPNATFTVYVNVVNHMGGTDIQTYQVQEKISPNPSGTQPAKTYDLSLKDGETWQDSASITLSQVGSYSVTFELWQNKNGTMVLTPNSCVLNISVTN
ncbi:MAG TPA: DUF1616 domain-containing protein [Candidatus Bathyarchaeia archaeon]